MTKPPATPDSLLTVAQVAERWQVSPNQVRRLIEDGRLAAVNVGMGREKARYRITQAACDRFVADQEPAPTPLRGRHLRLPSA